MEIGEDRGFLPGLFLNRFNISHLYGSSKKKFNLGLVYLKVQICIIAQKSAQTIKKDSKCFSCKFKPF